MLSCAPRRRAFVLLALATAALATALPGCADNETRFFVRAADVTDEAFAPDHLLSIEVELPAADFALLRDQGRTLGEICSMESPYDWFVGSVVIDGVRYENVEIRKKGFFGSVTSDRPSIKLRFAEGSGPYGLRRMTLNNDRQDPSHLRQCLSYRVMAEAGVPTPRCNHARVRINGEELGVYSHVDSMNKPFLRLYFDDEDGSLYEGQLGDFTDPHLPFIQSKTEERPGRDHLEALRDALELESDGAMLAAVERLVDVDAFLTFWAGEVLIGQWDGYTNNRNNYFAYRDPSNGKLYFMPWGPDATFTELRLNQGLGSVNGPQRSVFQTGRLAARLYELPSIKARYEARLAELLESAWDEPALLAEVDRIAALLGSDVNPAAAAQVRQYIQETRGEIEAELNGGLAPMNAGSVTPPQCLSEAAAISGTFDTTFDTLEIMALTESRGTLSWVSDPAAVNLPQSFDAVAGFDPEQMGAPTLRILGQRPSGQVVVFAFVLPPASFEGPQTISLTGLSMFAVVIELTFRSATPLVRPLGLMTEGELVFDEVSTVSGQPVRGSFHGTFFEQL